MNAPLVHRHLQANGVRLHVVLAGPEDGPLVVLLHGFPEFWYGWRRQIHALAAAGFRVAVPDQRGYHLSEKPRGIGAYDLPRLAGDVLGLLDALGRRQACVAGHDWGGAVAWHLAEHHPDRVERLAVLNVPHPYVMHRALLTSPAQRRKSKYIFFFQLPWLPEWRLRRDGCAALTWVLTRTSRPGTFTAEDFAHYRAAWTRPGALTAMLHWYRAAFWRALLHSPARPRITVPTRLIWGAQDFALGREMARPSIDLCADGDLVFIEEATHWVQHEEPGRVNDLLLGFFEPTA